MIRRPSSSKETNLRESLRAERSLPFFLLPSPAIQRRLIRHGATTRATRRRFFSLPRESNKLYLAAGHGQVSNGPDRGEAHPLSSFRKCRTLKVRREIATRPFLPLAFQLNTRAMPRVLSHQWAVAIVRQRERQMETSPFRIKGYRSAGYSQLFFS